MKQNNIIARAETSINAQVKEVWNALVDPASIKEYMFGTTVESDWKLGSAITWSGKWKGREYEDKGTVLKLEECKLLQYSHFSPLSGEDDIPENYHTVTVNYLEVRKIPMWYFRKKVISLFRLKNTRKRIGECCWTL